MSHGGLMVLLFPKTNMCCKDTCIYCGDDLAPGEYKECAGCVAELGRLPLPEQAEHIAAAMQ